MISSKINVFAIITSLQMSSLTFTPCLGSPRLAFPPENSLTSDTISLESAEEDFEGLLIMTSLSLGCSSAIDAPTVSDVFPAPQEASGLVT